MTINEALKLLEELSKTLKQQKWQFVGSINPQIIDLAIKSLELWNKCEKELDDYENYLYWQFIRGDNRGEYIGAVSCHDVFKKYLVELLKGEENGTV